MLVPYFLLADPCSGRPGTVVLRYLVQARDKRGRVLSRAGAAAQGFRMGLGGVMVVSRLQSRVGGVQE